MLCSLVLQFAVLFLLCNGIFHIISLFNLQKLILAQAGRYDILAVIRTEMSN